MATIYGKNYGKPSLDLNFAGNKSLIDTTTGTNYVTFSRAQSGNEATYVGSDGLIKYASADEPRFDHDPVTGESLGLLVEENRTNIFLSSTFTSSLWTEQNITKKSSNNHAPDGTNTAVLIGDATSTNTMSRLYYNTNQNGATRSFSFYAKATSAGQSAMIGYYDNGPNQGYAFVNLDNGNITYSAKIGDLVATATPIGSGWWRCQLVVTPAGSAAYYWMAGNAANGDIYIWGAQLETGSFPTSYIPTSGSTVTRAADEASITGTNFSSWYNQSEGSTLINYNAPNAIIDTDYPRLFAFNSGFATDFSTFAFNSANNSMFVNYVTGSSTKLSVSTTLPKNSNGTAALAYQDNNSIAFLNENSSTQGRTAGPMSTILNRLDIGGDSEFSSRMLNGTIARLTYYPKRLPDIELQQLTK